jgi:hypothetical protein
LIYGVFILPFAVVLLLALPKRATKSARPWKRQKRHKRESWVADRGQLCDVVGGRPFISWTRQYWNGRKGKQKRLKRLKRLERLERKGEVLTVFKACKYGVF